MVRRYSDKAILHRQKAEENQDCQGLRRIKLAKLYVVGIGPGDEEGMTLKARRVIEECSLVCGYGVYTELVKKIFPEKEYYVTPMKREAERCRYACERVKEGIKTCLVCSGDPGVFGLAGLCIKLSREYGIEVEVIPGVTAALSGAALLGAPLMGDFCVISLSDLLTPWEVIEKRIRAAASGDFPLCIYNPASKQRKEHLKKAIELLLPERSGDTVCGYVKNIGREGEEYEILPLKELKERELDMFTTVFIGASKTEEIAGRMVTERGYKTETEDA